MKTKAHFSIFTGLFTLVAILFTSLAPAVVPTAQAAFGISPPWIKNENALPNSSFTGKITLSTNNPEQDMIVKTEVTGDRSLKKWLTIQNEDDLIMKKGQSQFPLFVDVNVPKRAGIGEYRGKLNIRLEPLVKNNAGGIAIALGAVADIEINVTGDAVVDFRVSSARIDPIREGENIKVSLNVENKGNTAIEEIELKAEIWNQTEDELIQTLEGEQLDSKLDAYANGLVNVTIPAPELPEGSYWVKVKAFKEKIAVFETKVFLPVEASPERLAQQAAEEAEKEAAGKPGLPAKEEADDTEAEETKEVAEADEEEEKEEDLKAAADSGSNLLLTLAIAGVAFGFIALAAVIGVLVFLLKKQGNMPQAPSAREESDKHYKNISKGLL